MSKQWRVFLSKSHDIYVNLAWEDRLYRNTDFTDQNILLLWRNNPCVVIGRYQNPWKEANLKSLKKSNIVLARRFSGGGTVYHDLGNINFSFMTHRDLYNRRKNLDFIVHLLQKQYRIQAVVNKRDDIVVNGSLKVSGTAAKLGRRAAYHHCTLLCCVRKDQLHAALSPKNRGIQTNATASIPSPTINLMDVYPSVTVEALIEGYAQNFAAFNGRTGDWINSVDPTEDKYPGVSTTAIELQSQDFLFTKTPKFHIVREFHLPSMTSSPPLKFSMKITVENGKITEAMVDGNIPPEILAAVTDSFLAMNGLLFDSQEMWLTLSQSLSEVVHQSGAANNRLERDFVHQCIVRTLSLEE